MRPVLRLALLGIAACGSSTDTSDLEARIDALEQANQGLVADVAALQEALGTAGLTAEDVQQILDDGGYLTDADLDGYVQDADLDPYVRDTDLDAYALLTDLDPLAAQASVDALATRVDDLEAFDDDAIRYVTTSIEADVPGDYATIGEALDAFERMRFAPGVGAAIQLAPGTYSLTEQLVVTHPDGTSITIAGDETAPDDYVIEIADGGDRNNGIEVLRAGLSLNGLTIRKASGATGNGGLWANNSDVFVQGVVFEGWNYAAIVFNSSRVIANAVTVQDCARGVLVDHSVLQLRGSSITTTFAETLNPKANASVVVTNSTLTPGGNRLGVRVESAATVTLSGVVIAPGAGVGLDVAGGSSVAAAGLEVSGSITGVYAREGAWVDLDDALVTSTGTNATAFGVRAASGAFVDLANADVTAARVGVRAETGAFVDAFGVVVGGAATVAFEAADEGVLLATSAVPGDAGANDPDRVPTIGRIAE